jgi:DedD protein
MAKQMMDNEDSLRRRARRRLIGAVAITLVVVLLLPMLLDNEPKPVGQNIELRIPDKDKVGDFVPKMNLPSVSAPAAEPPVSVPPASVPVVVSGPVSASPAVSQVVATPAPAIAGISDSKALPTLAATNAQAGQEPDTAKPGEKAQTTPKSGFVVQIGAFSKAATAYNWQKKLSKRGFRVYTEKVSDKIRVRVGPYTTREAAEKSRHTLEAEGLHPNIIELK